MTAEKIVLRSTMIEIKGDPRLVFVKYFVKELGDKGWERDSRIVALSGMSEEEISALPPNPLFSEAFSALVETYRKVFRTLSISLNPTAPITRQEFEAVQARSSVRLRHRSLDDMINPFDPGGDGVFGSEYALLVNLAARRAKAKGFGLGGYDIFKLTLLAAIQRGI